MADDYELVHLETRAQLREWLTEHHTRPKGVWLVQWRSGHGGPAIPYDDTVEELLCFGWIDSTVRKLDEDRSALRITPRKKGSAWSQSNKIRLERLEAQGLMAPSGTEVVERAKADGSWTLLDDIDAMVMPDDLVAALGDAGATAKFEALSPGRRKQTLWWIKSAKRDATRETRIAKVVEAALEGRAAVG